MIAASAARASQPTPSVWRNEQLTAVAQTVVSRLVVAPLYLADALVGGWPPGDARCVIPTLDWKIARHFWHRVTGSQGPLPLRRSVTAQAERGGGPAPCVLTRRPCVQQPDTAPALRCVHAPPARCTPQCTTHAVCLQPQALCQSKHSTNRIAWWLQGGASRLAAHLPPAATE